MIAFIDLPTIILLTIGLMLAVAGLYWLAITAETLVDEHGVKK